MKDLISKLNKLFDSRVRVGIMSILLRSNWVDFSTLKEALGTTDGNLSSHLTSLEKSNMIKLKRQFVNNRPRTSYKITRQGLRRFSEHLEAYEMLTKG